MLKEFSIKTTSSKQSREILNKLGELGYNQFHEYNGSASNVYYSLSSAGTGHCSNTIYGKIFDTLEDFIKEHEASEQLNDKFEVDKQFILDAHDAACDKWKAKLEDKYPEIFVKEKYFKFGNEYKLTTSSDVLVIGLYSAPLELQRKCLIVDYGYEPKIQMHDGRYIIALEKKN